MPRKSVILLLAIAILGTVVVIYYSSYYKGMTSRQTLHRFDSPVENDYSEGETIYFHAKYRKGHKGKVNFTKGSANTQEQYRMRTTTEVSKTSTSSTTPTTGKKGVSTDGLKKTKYMRFNKTAPPWFTRDDVEKMVFLATANISKVLPHIHPGLNPIVFDDYRFRNIRISDMEQCESQCGLLKSTEDIFEVFSFHLDRVLGLNRTLPAIARKFRGHPEFGYPSMDGKARPLIWWSTDVVQGHGKFQNDQNSLELSWLNYTTVLKNRCWADGTTPDSEEFCTPIKHIEWSKLAMFDFLLQVYDRLDRNCCGFNKTLETQGEKCFTDGRYKECETPDVLMLVHMLTRKSDPSRLVYIDNAGRPFRSERNIDWRLLQGIDEFPEGAVALLRDPNVFRRRLLQSLYIDRAFWKSVGLKTVMEAVQNVVNRGQLLAEYIDKKGIAVVPDY